MLMHDTTGTYSLAKDPDPQFTCMHAGMKIPAGIFIPACR